MSKPRILSMVFAALACALLALPVLADSQARIVRLSDVQGSVQIDKNTGLGFENAFLNLPITQGTQLRTKGNGRAEVEMEDGSSIRLTPDTTLIFSKLGLNDEGKRVSVVDVVEGKAYVNWLGKDGDQFTLNFSREKVELGKEAAHFRVTATTSLAEVVSFKSDLEVVGPSGTVRVGKKKTVTFDVNDNDKATLAKNFEKDPYDDWDKQSVAYHDQYAKNNNTPYGYGYSDLNYYGAYTNVSGYGTLWQPYFTGIGWDPFMDGAWAWYPGFGYMYASAYPWGWMPYYYGNWVYAPGFGWGWLPGNWGGWTGVPRFPTNPPQRFHPPTPPVGSGTTVTMGRGGPVLQSAPLSLTTVRSGSAGLGIARGSFGSLRGLNSQVAKSGSVVVQPSPQFGATARGGSGTFGGSHPAGSSGAGHVSSSGMSHSSGGHSSGGGGSHH